MIDAGTPDPEQRRMALTLGLRSAMLLPLTVDQKPFGVLSFLTAESGRRYGREDLILATEIARASLPGRRKCARVHRGPDGDRDARQLPGDRLS